MHYNLHTAHLNPLRSSTDHVARTEPAIEDGVWEENTHQFKLLGMPTMSHANFDAFNTCTHFKKFSLNLNH